MWAWNTPASGKGDSGWTSDIPGRWPGRRWRSRGVGTNATEAPGPHPSADPAVRDRARSGGGGDPVGVEDELPCRPLIEVPVTLRSVLQGDDRGVDRVGDLGPVVEDHLHQQPVVPLDRTLPGGERVRLGPAQPDADPELSDLGVLVDPARVTGHIQPGNP